MANRRYIDFPIASSVGDSDIILIWQSGANKQTTKATFLSGLPENLDELNDVAISGLTNGQILRYDSVTGKWENTDQGNLDLNDLNDVSIVSPSNGQVLVYNSSTSKWENSSGGYVPYTGAVTTVNLGAQTIQAGSFVKAGGTAAQFLKADGSVDSNTYGTGTVTSVALTMPSAFSVANSPITTAGTLAVTGAGTVGQYIRGDGSLADFPESSGGGSSVSYYLNGSVAQGTIGGVAYKELNKVPVLGAGTDFSIAADGYIASFITDAGDPNLLEIPGGNWNFETYFSASSSGGTPSFYVELYKVNSGGTATLIASNSGFPELIAFGTNIISYFSTLAVPTTTLALTDRLAVRYYVTHSGRTITLHTEDNHLCQIITTFTTGLTALNGLTAQIQNFAVGTSGTDFAIASATATHTFNLPTASATNRGALSSADWTTFNGKQNALTNPVTGTGTTNYLPKFTGASTIGNSLIFDNGTNVGINTNSPSAWNGSQGTIVSQYSASGNTIYSAQSNTTNVDTGGIFEGFSNAVTGGSKALGSIAFLRENTSTTALNSYTAFYTNNAGVVSEKSRFTSSGNFGMGTINPTSASGLAFVLNSGASQGRFVIKTSASGDASGNGLQIGMSGIDAFIEQRENSTLDFATNALTSMRLFNDGNVLIQRGGTFTNNNAKLQVSGTAIISGNVGLGTLTPFSVTNFTTLTINGTNASLIEMQAGGTSYARIQANSSEMSIIARGNTPMVFYTNPASDTERLRIFVGGNVHIGPTPVSDNGAKLQVSGTATVSGNVAIGTNPASASVGAVIRLPFDNAIRWRNSSNTADLGFYLGGSNLFTFDSGISVTGAATFSSSVTSNGAKPQLYVSGNSGNGAGIHLTTALSGSNRRNWGIFTEENIEGDFAIKSSSSAGGNPNSGTTRFSILSNGLVDISGPFVVRGTLPADQTDAAVIDHNGSTMRIFSYGVSGVTGSFEFRTAAGGAGSNLVSTINGTTGAYTAVSDVNKKKDFEESTIGLNAILGLKPTLYRMKSETNTQKHLGFIAQEVRQYIPNAYVENGEFIGLNEMPIIAALTKAIQELKQEIDTLKN